MDEYARQVAEGKDVADAAGKDLEQAKAGLADAKADASEKDEERRPVRAVQSMMRQNRRSRTQRQPSLSHERHNPSASPSSSRHSPLRQRHKPT